MKRIERFDACSASMAGARPRCHSLYSEQP